MIKNKNILVVGGTGFIGYHLIKRALKEGLNVTSLSTRRPKKIRKVKKVKYIFCDITNKKLLNKLSHYNFHYVVNLGGYVDHTNKKKTFYSHYYGCKNLVESINRNNLEAFVQIGSCLEYGLLKSPQVEKKTSAPKANYAKAKYFASKYLIKENKKNKFPCTVLRAYQVYGEKQDLNRFLPIVINGCIKKIKFPCSEGLQYRDFLHIDDFVSAIVLILKSKKGKGQIINIGYGKTHQIKKTILRIQKIIKGGEPMFSKIKLRKEEMMSLYPDIRKAKKILGWRPKVSFNKGLKKTIKYYQREKFS